MREEIRIEIDRDSSRWSIIATISWTEIVQSAYTLLRDRHTHTSPWIQFTHKYINMYGVCTNILQFEFRNELDRSKIYLSNRATGGVFIGLVAVVAPLISCDHIGWMAAPYISMLRRKCAVFIWPCVSICTYVYAVSTHEHAARAA